MTLTNGYDNHMAYSIEATFRVPIIGHEDELIPLEGQSYVRTKHIPFIDIDSFIDLLKERDITIDTSLEYSSEFVRYAKQTSEVLLGTTFHARVNSEILKYHLRTRRIPPHSIFISLEKDRDKKNVECRLEIGYLNSLNTDLVTFIEQSLYDVYRVKAASD